jgi:hypothetical protein
MTRRLAITVAATGLVLGAFAIVSAGTIRLPGDDSGYEPEQPIRFSHRLHAGELGVDCLYCHYGAEKSKHAGIPAASVCMNCHRTVTAPWEAVRAEAQAAAVEKREPKRVVSPELAKLYAAIESGRPIEWVKVHNLPDFVAFDHRRHVNGGVACEACHGPVKTMERVRQTATLAMGWCIDCHRGGATATAAGVKAVGVSTDCAGCHY